MTTNLSLLIARLEAATGPDREIDAMLWIELAGDDRVVWEGDRLTAHDQAGHVRVIGSIDPDERGRNFLLWGYEREIPRYTASLDACAALQERVLPGHRRNVRGFDPDFQIDVSIHAPPEFYSVAAAGHALETHAWLIAILSAVMATRKAADAQRENGR